MELIKSLNRNQFSIKDKSGTTLKHFICKVRGLWLLSASRKTALKNNEYWRSVIYEVTRLNRTYERFKKEYVYECDICHNYFSRKEVQVDHIIDLPSFSIPHSSKLEELPFAELSRFMAHLFCNVKGLRVLCKSCHKLRSKEQIKIRRSKLKELL